MKIFAKILLFTILQISSLVIANDTSTYDFSHDDISGQIILDSNIISINKNTELSIFIKHSKTQEIELDTINDKQFIGFSVIGKLKEKSDLGTTYYINLEPKVGVKEYKILKMPIVVTDLSTIPNSTNWFLTPIIPLEKKVETKTSDEFDKTLSPRKIPVSIKRIFKYVSFVVLIGVIVFLLFKAVKFIKFKAALKQMSAHDRAIYELKILASKKLLDKNLFDEYYMELTLIIRKYIERTYGIKAPERTTEEFLHEASALENFPKELIPDLRKFLSSADLVKFAKASVTVDTALSATDNAKTFVEKDTDYRETNIQEKGNK